MSDPSPPAAQPPGLLGVLATDGGEPRAASLAARLGVPLLTEPAPGLLLVVHADRLELRDGSPGAPGALVVDLSTQFARRGGQGAWRHEPLVRALGWRRRVTPPAVLDATLGLARDALVLAALGCRVTGCERSPVVAALLEDGIRRGRREPRLAEVLARLTLHPLDARDLLARLADADRPDVICIDPMFPERRKAAQVRKDMQMFQRLLGSSRDEPDLLRQALACAKDRVLVKRPRGAPPWIDDPAPSHRVAGRSMCIDVYLIGAPGRPRGTTPATRASRPPGPRAE